MSPRSFSPHAGTSRRSDSSATRRSGTGPSGSRSAVPLVAGTDGEAGVFEPAIFDRPRPAELSQGTWQDDERFVASLRASWERQYADYLGRDGARRLIASLERSGALYRHHEPATLIASMDGRPVGITALRPLGELSLITMLEVVPAYRGRGIGSQLLRAMCSGAHTLVAHVSIHRPRVRAWYVSAGFVVLRRSVVDHHGHPLMFDVVARTNRSGTVGGDG